MTMFGRAFMLSLQVRVALLQWPVVDGGCGWQQSMLWVPHGWQKAGAAPVFGLSPHTVKAPPKHEFPSA
jgi:hypothetical protein